VTARNGLLAALLAVWLGGCGLFGGDDDAVEPPAELVDFQSEIDVRRVWNTRVGRNAEGLRLGLTPATDGVNIYAGAYDGRVEGLNADTGRTVWSVRTDVPLSAGPGYGNGLLAFGTADGQLMLLDASDGTERWRRPVGSEVLAPPAVSANVVVFRSVDGRLRGFSTSNGRELWSVEQSLPALTLRGDTPPRISGQVVVSGFDNGRIGAYELSTGNAIWEIPIANPTGTNELERLVDVSSGLEIVGNDVYTVGYQGSAVSIDLTTGLVLWRQEISSFAGLGVDLGSVYVTNDEGVVVALDRRTGGVTWRQEALLRRDVTAPTRFVDTVAVGDFDGYIHWLDPEDGHFVGRARAASGRIAGPPLVVGAMMYVQADDGTVAAFTIRDDSA
jgi:outer membrane protein assembly factor BamB